MEYRKIHHSSAAKKKILLLCAACGLSSVIAICVLWGPVIFQRGDPRPYLSAALAIGHRYPYAQVSTQTGGAVFLTRNSSCPELIRHIEEKWSTKFRERGGSAYLFSSAGQQLVVSTEILWGRYIVWDVPDAEIP